MSLNGTAENVKAVMKEFQGESTENGVQSENSIKIICLANHAHRRIYISIHYAHAKQNLLHVLTIIVNNFILLTN
jgi:hypothetical protein